MNYDTLLEAAQFLPSRLEYPGSWIGHIPFASWLIQSIKPSIFVELGTHSGNSYLAFCQAIKEFRLPTRCYAIDTWKGDEHAGFYGEEIFQNLKSFHDEHYSSFSTLMRMTFDEGASYFVDGSIELLHIDGLHTYDAIRHDFETWYPKLAPHAVVVFHDTNVHEREFGVWRFWQEIRLQFELNFEFFHSYGLGIVQISKGLDNFELEWLNPDFPNRNILREYFSSLGHGLVEKFQIQVLEKSISELVLASEKSNSELKQSSDKFIVELQTELQVNQEKLAALGQEAQNNREKLAVRDQEAQNDETILADREKKIVILLSQLAEHAQQVEALTFQNEQREIESAKVQIQLSNLEQQASLLSVQKNNLTQELKDLNDFLEEREKILQDLNSRLLEILNSTAWTVIQLMWRVRLWLVPKGSWREKVCYTLLERIKKNRSLLKDRSAVVVNENSNEGIFKTPSIENMDEMNLIERESSNFKELYNDMLSVAKGEKGDNYYDISDVDFSPKNNPVKLISFYLPQFHPLPENDLWWGKGFTEWTNVSKAIPQFYGHYQPHLPGELGFYDLRVPEVQRRQVELAKKYGIYGFCFHYYWFNGKRLLERPLDQFIADPEIDFPFCLCWANENWTRRWDGLENDILLAQEYQEDSDLIFMEDIHPYFQNKNYIKINGRPILIVYRVSMMPNPKLTAQRWREYCKQKGYPEPYLIAAQTFGFTDPNSVDFDAAVEFPPLNYSLNTINHTIQQINPQYQGMVFSYPDIVSRSIEKEVSSNVFRTVFPSWDNEARKPGKGSSFIPSSPQLYQAWLDHICNQALSKVNPDEKIVFINAWNEWAEGAHLEPDRKYGYAYLQATMDILRDISNGHQDINLTFGRPEPFGPITKRSDVAVILHLYYPDLWEEITTYLDNLDNDFDLFISIPTDKDFPVDIILKKYPNAYIYCCQNKGRDIGPFIKILNAIYHKGYKYYCKIHTKKSTHRNDGTTWRMDMYNKLLGSKERIHKIKEIFTDQPDLGIVAPSVHVVPLNFYLASNEAHIRKLTRLLHMPFRINSSFVAGSMFWCRAIILYPLMTLKIEDCDFEEELGQSDGTLAHGIERLIGIINTEIGYQILEINEAGTFTHHTNKSNVDYPFAMPSNINNYNV